MRYDFSTATNFLRIMERMQEKVRYGLCERKCLISPSQREHFKTRENVDGKLYTLVYGDIRALESRLIEIKPLFHYDSLLIEFLNINLYN